MSEQIDKNFYTAIIDKNIPYLQGSNAKCNIRVDVTVDNNKVFMKLIEYIDEFKFVE